MNENELCLNKVMKKLMKRMQFLFVLNFFLKDTDFFKSTHLLVVGRKYIF